MGQYSSIEWTHHTFNPWWGCIKVSAACKNCYAETWAKRVGSKVWGPKSNRRFFTDAHWKQPLKWNRIAEGLGERHRVFCASMADVFEDRRDLDEWRERLWAVIEQTPWLDWLLLTKRPECIGDLSPWRDKWPHNVWLGTTIERQKWVDSRMRELSKYPAIVRFLSCEPLLGELDLRSWLKTASVDWIIAGGESGAKARVMDPAWVEDLRDQCVENGVSFHFKQWGHWAPVEELTTSRGKTRVVEREDGSRVFLAGVGKKAAGRLLEGRTWDGCPAPLSEVSGKERERRQSGAAENIR